MGKGRKAKKPVHTVLANGVDLFFFALFREVDHCDNSIVIDDDRFAISTRLKEIIDGTYNSRRS